MTKETAVIVEELLDIAHGINEVQRELQEVQATLAPHAADLDQDPAMDDVATRITRTIICVVRDNLAPATRELEAAAQRLVHGRAGKQAEAEAGGQRE